MSLSASDFAAFYEEVHCRAPFAWQEDLAHTVCKSGWPKYLDMPTATGKTSVIDIAVFHLALEGCKAGRRAPLRIAYVVDRRLVVDGASEHAARIADRIVTAKGPVTQQVAESLGSFSAGRPLETAKLRGGMPRDNDWAKTPSQPTVITSTVDQVGSRLLFRGYGVSDLMKPVHAGLLGTDTLFLLDEAHTSQPFLDTLEQIESLKADNKWGGGLPFDCMFMSATLGGAGKGTYPPADKSDALLRGDDAIRRRLDAHKIAQLVEVPAGCGEDSMISAALDLAYPKKSVSGDGPLNIGIVVNRVDAARHIHARLRDRLDKRSSGDDAAAAHLLIGRARPLERDMLVKKEIDKIRPGRCRRVDPCADDDGADGDTAHRVTFFVATQCIEVGVDADFDALVTQIAPLDSLRQRFGRLDRIGSRGVTDAVIVATKEEASKRYEDPVYGDSMPKAWGYLKGIARKNAGKSVVDFGVSHFKMRGEWNDATAPRAASATLMPPYLGMWSQTWPRPDPDPDPGLFLHGKGAGPADVQVVWRADFTEEFLKNKIDLDAMGLSVCGPSTLEAVSLPVWTARRWLGGRRDDDGVADLEGTTGGNGDEDEGRPGRSNERPCAVRWRGARSDETRIIHAGEIRPGDTLVVPSESGRCDRYGWDKHGSDPVRDIGMEASLLHRSSMTMRLGGQYLSQVHFGDDGAASEIKRVAADFADRDDDDVLDALADIDGIPEAWKHAIGLARGDKKVTRQVHVQRSGAAGDRPRVAGIRIAVDRNEADELMRMIRQDDDCTPTHPQADDAQGSPSTEDGEECEIGASSILADHCKGVEDLAGKFGKAIGMDEKLRGDLTLAARLHDAGKAEKRVQALWRGVDPDDLGDYEDMAKSIIDMPNRDAYLRCLRLARLPKKYRHECWSVRMAESHPALGNAHDRDLVLYLIGTHHGYGRPLFPPVDDVHAAGSVEWSLDGVDMKADAVHGMERLDSGWIEMCERLYEKYGPWRLAHMEAILRLADHRRSGEERGNE